MSTSAAAFDTALIFGFAMLSLALAAVGLYGVLSYVVTQRTPELGIRLALGAKRAELVRLVLLDGMRPTVVGMAFGLAVAKARGSRMLKYQARRRRAPAPLSSNHVARWCRLTGGVFDAREVRVEDLFAVRIGVAEHACVRAGPSSRNPLRICSELLEAAAGYVPGRDGWRCR
jgi:hypothetical protein